MKPLLLTLTLATALASSAKAEYYRPSVVRDTTVVGAVAGALIGGHNGDRWAQGALIGAAAGAVVGTVMDNSQPRRVEYRERVVEPVAVVPCAPTVGTTVVTTAPRVVYVNQAPPTRVVYVDACPPPVVMARPVVVINAGRHYGYRAPHRHYHGHRW